MSQKVWVVREHNERAVADAQITGRISEFHQEKPKHRNPALAYSLSLFFWGCGQLYNRRWRSGILLFFSMVIFCSSMCMIVIYWNSLVNFFGSINISRSETLLICAFFYFSGSLVWYFNSCHAYFKTVRNNGYPFEGVKSVLLPVVCSFLIPGWGQFLNGQSKKGVFFQIFWFAGLIALPAVLVVSMIWSTLDSSQARLVIEWIFTISIIFTPFILTIWLFGIYDAARVSMDNLRREPFRKRIQYQINRYRHNIQMCGWGNTILPITKRIVLIILLLVFGAVNYQYIPKSYYIRHLQGLGDRFSQKGMTVIPHLINNFGNYISPGRED